MKKTVRVLIVDDSPVALAAIRSCLEAIREIEIVGTARNGFELPEKAEKLEPDVIITDLHMPRMNGLEITLSLRERMASTRFIVITDIPRPLEGISPSSNFNDRYFGKNTSPEEVLAEIRNLFPEVFGGAHGTSGSVESQGALKSNTPLDGAEGRGERSTPHSHDHFETGYC